ncbi:MAG TPA: DNA repair protein RecO [Gemmatimonadales bacterium]|nr:DNA repair protein RecO [Gemmatimonadales bacterium]
MSLVSTPAIVLHAFPYGETSKIVRLATREYGVQSAIAKGAQRPKSRFGAQLQLLSGGTAFLYLKPHRDLHTLTSFDLTTQRPRLARDVRRYAAAAALAELVLRCAPAEPHPELYDIVDEGLNRLGEAEGAGLETTALAVLWQAIAALGFSPAVEACARCGSEITGDAVFSLPEGGLLCGRCSTASRLTGRGRLTAEDQAALQAFIEGRDVPPSALSPRHVEAHRRLVARFVRRHLGEERDLKALAFWEGAT